MKPTEKWLQEHFTVQEIIGDEARCFCPMHDDGARGALYINLISGKWKCHAKCGAGSLGSLCARLKIKRPSKKDEEGAVVSEAETRPTKFVPMEEVDAAVKRLWTKPGQGCLKALRARGIEAAVLKRFRIGASEDGLRAWFPVFASDGQCVNVRQYDWTRTSRDKYQAYAAGYGEMRLWPAGIVERHQEVIIFEGETDCLLAHSLGMDNAITATGGAGGWEARFTRAITGKDVLVCYDIDDAGRAGAAALQRTLHISARSVRTVHLPISEPANGDFTDYVRAVGGDRKKVLQLFGESRAAAVSPSERAVFAGLSALDPTAGKPKSLRAVVSGKDLTPFNVPGRVNISCVPQAKSTSCQACPLLAGGGETLVEIPLTSKVVLKSVLATDGMVDQAVRDYCRIPARCPGHQQDIVKTTPLWDLRLSPDVDSTEEEGSEGSRRAFSMTDLATNQPYELQIVACSDPKTQYALLHILEAKSSLTSLDNWTAKGKEKLLALWEP